MKIKKLAISTRKWLSRLFFRTNIDSRSRLHPFTSDFGYKRGTPIDRYYIEYAINEYSQHIQGCVLEVGDDTYTEAFSDTPPEKSYILNYTPITGNNVIVGDLTDYDSMPALNFDTFICTQTLNFIYDFPSAIETSYKLLNKGGVFLGTVASVCNISIYDDARWGDYWRFTLSGIKEAFARSKFEVLDLSCHGNLLAAKALLDGFTVEDFNDINLLEYVDPAYPVIISFLCRKTE
jgi:hypothetical protein